MSRFVNLSNTFMQFLHMANSRLLVSSSLLGSKSIAASINRSAAVSATAHVKHDRKQRKDKDKNKPKRPMTAYLHFLHDFRPEFKRLHPEDASGQQGVLMVAQAGAAKWRLMPKHEKEQYEQRAQESRVRLINIIVPFICLHMYICPYL